MSGSGSDSDMDDDKIVEEKLKPIDARLTENIEDYDAHLLKIALLREFGEMERLTASREKFSEVFPLTDKIWLEWISDEQKIASSAEDAARIHGLFERAVQDYLSVDLWLEFCQFSIADVESEENILKARNTFEKAISAGGLHVAKGALIWEMYRVFENALFLAGKEKSKGKVDKIFRRQLAVPLLDMEATMEEYQGFLEGNNIDSNVKRSYDLGVKMLAARTPFEEKLLQTDDPESKMEIYSDYLKLEFGERNPPRLQILFERRCADHCLNPHVWIKYVDYLEKELKIKNVTETVFSRAIRNVSFSAELWIKYFRFLERNEETLTRIRSTFETAISKTFYDPQSYGKLWLTYIDYFRRNTDLSIDENQDKIRSIFSKSTQHLIALGVLVTDPSMRVWKYWANIEADRFRSVDEARKIWSSVVEILGDSSQTWMEYILLEQVHGDFKHLRRLYGRALERTQDNPVVVGEAWIQFEREEGTLEQFEEAESKVAQRLSRWHDSQKPPEPERRKRKWDGKESKDEQKSKKKNTQEFKMPPAPPPKSENEEKRTVCLRNLDVSATKEQITKVFKSSGTIEEVRLMKSGAGKSEGVAYVKFSKEVEAQCALKQDHQMVSNRPVFVTEYKKDQVSGSLEKTAKLEKKIAPPPGYKGGAKSEGSNLQEKRPGVEKKIAPPPGYKGDHKCENEEKRTVFLSNLDFSATEEEIMEVFKSSGSIEEVRLVKNYAGKSKGFAYVKFSKEVEAQNALERDHELVANRPVFVSEFKKDQGSGPPSEKQFKFSTSLEKNKLFVKGLSFNTTKEDLEMYFAEHGRVKEVRLVTYRNGHSKGLAYIEFVDEESASKALVKTDGKTIDGREISVALSNPPARKEQQEKIKSLGGASKELMSGPRGKGRSQVSFVPRSVQTKAAETNGSNGNAVKKTNEDFRNMLLKKQ